MVVWVEMDCLAVAAGRVYDGIGEKHGSKFPWLSRWHVTRVIQGLKS